MEGESLATSRSRRQRSDKSGRLAALEKISQLKGGKHKYEIKPEKPVYDVVSETEYSKNVQSRLEDDWIVDDGTGYCDDGREIFDDDEDEEPAQTAKATKERKSYAPPTKKVEPKKTGDIKSMFMNLPAKKKVEKEVKLEDDELLGDIMKDIHNSVSPASRTPKPTLLKKKSTPIQESPKTFRRPSNPFVRKSISRVLEEPEFNSYTQIKDSSTRQPKRKSDDGEKTASTKLAKTETGPSVIEEFDSQECEVPDVKITDTEDVDDTISEKIFNDTESKPVEQEEKDVSSSKFKVERNYVIVKPEITPKESFQGAWEHSIGSGSTEHVHNDVHVDLSHLPMTTNDKGESVLKCYWLDAYEDYFKHPGVVYLFGKVWIETAKTWVSCCTVVKNIDRKVYLLKRDKKVDKNGSETEENCSFQDVYSEFCNEIMDKYKIPEFRCKYSTKFYSFEKEGVPHEGEYLELFYPANCPQLPVDLKGKTFSHVFGTNTSSLEQLLIDRKMKGPSWLEIKNPCLSDPPISWCKFEVVLNSPNQVSVMASSSALPPPPPLVVMSLSMRTCLNPTSRQNEIVAVACLAHLSFPLDKAAPKVPFQSHFCAITKPSHTIFPYGIKEEIAKYKNSKVERIENERAMLNFLLAKIHKTDPDMIVGHDIIGFDLKLLLHRMNDLKINQWSRLGRLRRTVMPKIVNAGRGFQAERSVTCGRLICDIQVSAKELIRSKSYDLSQLVEQVLHLNHEPVTSEQILSKYEKSSELIKLIDSTLLDGSYILKLMCELNVLPLALQITNIAGNLMARTLLGGRSERNEYLLLHAFHEKNYIYPDKIFDKSSKKENVGIEEDEDLEVAGGKKSSRKKPSYAGGLVLDPKKGFYDKYILLMDFNSLYPSIIQEYNICFTTVSKPGKKTNNEEDVLVELPDADAPPGILPTEIRKLVESRQQVKQLMKDPKLTFDQRMQYDIRQKALKLTANSMYGCLGFSNSRFYAKPLAALVTSKGREILMLTKELVQKMGLDVIYGDTDSIMINSNCVDFEEVLKLGNKVKNEVNKLYRQLEIDIDGLYKPMLLLKKKKYAAVSVSKASDSGELKKVQEMKGLDIVRRDWSDLAKEAGTYVISQILSDNMRDEVIESIHVFLKELGESVKSGETSLEKFIINKQLTKNPEDYPDKKSLAHVQVAIRMNSKSSKKLKQGDTVFYVICQDGTTNSAVQRSYHPDEIKGNESLQIDTHYYLSQQVLPVVSRLCEPIDGLDTPTIADLLGLDPSSYKQHTQYQSREEDSSLGSESIFNDENRFVDCAPITFTCPSSECDGIIQFKEPFKGTGVEFECTLDKCPTCKSPMKNFETSLKNQLTKCIREYIQKYYLCWMVCEDPSCCFRTRKLGLRVTRAGPVCPSCDRSGLKLEFTETQLYLQLTCFQKALDATEALNKLQDIEKRKAQSVLNSNEGLYRHLKEIVDKYQERNAYGKVDLCKLFQGLFKASATINGHV